MSEQTTQDKTEKASPQKLKKAKDQGQVARSKEAATAVGIFVVLQLLVLLMPGYLEDFRTLFAASFEPLRWEHAFGSSWGVFLSDAIWLLFKMLLPLVVVPLAILLVSLFPGGWVLNATHLAPKFSRLNPISNLGRLFKGKHWSGFAASVARAVLLGLALFYLCRSTVEEYTRLQGMTLDLALLRGAGLMMEGVLALCLVFVIFAFIDVPIQKFFFLREQRMTKQDVKEEHKTSEGRPEVKQRIRRLQQQIAQRSVRKSVPTADVIIVNPEHYAVALKYDEDRAEAPFVIAKGIDEMALYIRQVAAEHGVEVVTLPPLARAIYNTSQVNQQIPAALYNAVAQVLSYVLQLKAFQSGRRKAFPAFPADLAVPSHLT